MTVTMNRPSPFRGAFDRMLFAIPPFVLVPETSSPDKLEGNMLKENLDASMWHRNTSESDPNLRGVLAYLDSLI
ncbi:MAG: hypothetical protein JSV66_04885 [Trueperaceae bacterium]|nr:MAG: hypothetical protein JSV66_04885 [Trueperaceae bacterium]